MKRLMGTPGIAALIVSAIAVVITAAGTSSASTDHNAKKTGVHRATKTSAGPVTKTFSFVGPRGSKTVNVVNIDGLTINRCGSGGQPVIFAFTNAPKADIFGRIFDGTGRLVTVQYAFDNATTLGKQNVCTVFGSVVAS
jgi:hypothetical protein